MTKHTEIFYISRNDGWALAEFDSEGNQIGPASYEFHKKSAIKAATECGLPVHVFNAYGDLQRIIGVVA